MKTQTDLERIWEIKDYLTELNSIVSKKPVSLMKIKLYWLEKIETLKIKINRNYETIKY